MFNPKEVAEEFTNATQAEEEAALLRIVSLKKYQQAEKIWKQCKIDYRGFPVKFLRRIFQKRHDSNSDYE